MKATRIELEGRPLSAFTFGGTWRPAPPGIPPEVRIGAEVWRVLMHTHLYSSKHKASRLAGCAIRHERVIILDPEIPGHELRSVLGHEMSHALLFAAKETNGHLRKLTDEQEEALCDLFADAVFR